MHNDEDIDAAEASHVDDLCGVFVSIAQILGVPEWVREAIASSIDNGWVRDVVVRAMRDAHRRGQQDTSHPTPVIEVIDDDSFSPAQRPLNEDSTMRPTLPTVPPGVDAVVDQSDVPTARVRKLTRSYAPE